MLRLALYERLTAFRKVPQVVFCSVFCTHWEVDLTSRGWWCLHLAADWLIIFSLLSRKGKTVLMHREVFNQDVPPSILILICWISSWLTKNSSGKKKEKKWFLQNGIADTSFVIMLSTKRNSPPSMTGNFTFRKSVVSFKYIPGRLYASLPATAIAITLIARVAPRNAIPGLCLRVSPPPFIWWGERAEREGVGRKCEEINGSIRVMDIVEWRGGISTGKILILLEKSKRLKSVGSFSNTAMLV